MSENKPRPMLDADLRFDPTYSRQRFVARYIIGALINKLRGRTGMFYGEQSPQSLADQAEKICREEGILPTPDDLKHAPACPANRWASQMLPTAPCNCGAVR